MALRRGGSALLAQPRPGSVDTEEIYSIISSLQVRQPLASYSARATVPRSFPQEALPYCPSEASTSTSKSRTDGGSIFSARTSASSHLTYPSTSSEGTLFSEGSSSIGTQSDAMTLPTQTEPGSRYDDLDGIEPLSEPARLPCEYAKYSGKGWTCDVTFALDDVEGWIEHVGETHFQHNYPPKSICWFCDDKQGQFFTDSNKQDDRARNFDRRMRHIAEHYREPNWERLRRRPDFFVNDFLVDTRLVNPSMRAESEEWSEIQKPKWWQEEHEASKAPRGERVEAGRAITNQTCGKRRQRAVRGYHE